MKREVCTVYNHTFNDIAYVRKKKDFENSKQKYSLKLVIPGTETVGCIDRTGRIITLEDNISSTFYGTKITVSELTNEKLKSYKSSDYVVYIIAHEYNYSNGETIYSIEENIAPNLYLLKKEFSTTDAEYIRADEYDYTYCFISFNTRGNQKYSSSNVYDVELIDTYMWGDSANNGNYIIIDNTVFLTTEACINDGWASGDGEIWVFDKRDGHYVEVTSEGGTVTYRKQNGESYMSNDVLLSRLYTRDYSDENEHNSEKLIEGCVILGGKIFDTNAVSYVYADREPAMVGNRVLEMYDENEYIIYSDHDYTMTLKKEDGKYCIETYNEGYDDEKYE